MSNGSRPAVLVSEMLSGDGPHLHAAEEFLAGTCARCGGPVERRSSEDTGDRAQCAMCLTRRSVGLTA